MKGDDLIGLLTSRVRNIGERQKRCCSRREIPNATGKLPQRRSVNVYPSFLLVVSFGLMIFIRKLNAQAGE